MLRVQRKSGNQATLLILGRSEWLGSVLGIILDNADRIEALARSENRTISNWIVTSVLQVLAHRFQPENQP